MSWPSHTLPPWLRQVSAGTLKADLLAGITGAVVVLPQGIAYAMIAGLPPQYGLYTAIVVPVIAGLLGSSRHLVCGPTATISVLVASVLAGMAAPASPAYIGLAITLTLLAGLFQLGFALARLGSLINFISHTVIIGFTAGAGIIIALSQLPNLLGLPAAGGGSAALAQALAPAAMPRTLMSLALFGLTAAACLLIRRLRPRWPALLIAMLAGSVAGWLVDAGGRGVPMVGAIPGSLPPLSLPAFSPGILRELAPGALAIAALGLIQTVSIARAIALRSGQSLDSNREFMGQGVSNAIGSFFSCYAASGSFTRSAVNYEAGARTPLATVLASLALAAIVLSLPRASAYLPIPVVAAIIVIIAWGLLDLGAIRNVLHSGREEGSVLLATFAGAVLVSLEFAIAIGVVASLMFYLRQTSQPRVVPVAPHPGRPGRGLRNADKHGLPECPQLRILRLDDSLFFGAVEHVQRELQRLTAPPQPQRVLLVCNAVNLIDLAGVQLLVREAERLAAAGGGLYLCGLRDEPRQALAQGCEGTLLGEGHLFGDPALAIAALVPSMVEPSSCANCQARRSDTCVLALAGAEPRPLRHEGSR